MNDYTIERFKKEAETETLFYFLEAYEKVTKQPIELFEITERPDFICAREDGSRVGIELVKVTRGDPEEMLWHELIDRQPYMSVDHALEMLQQVAEVKEKKRREADWRVPNSTFLLIELADIPLAEIESCIAQTTLPDLYSTGFLELWLADFTGLEAFDNVELLCVQPHEWAGYYPRGLQKPYG